MWGPPSGGPIVGRGGRLQAARRLRFRLFMPGYPEHLREFDYVGPHRYFLTFCTFERRPHFRNRANVDLVCEQFVRASRSTRMAVIAYCFMPDHVHLLVAGVREDSLLKPFIKAAKQYSGFYFKQQRGIALWQRYGFEHVLRSEEATEAVARYVIANPVRAGLVTQPRDYPFWGSFVYSREELLEYIMRAA